MHTNHLNHTNTYLQIRQLCMHASFLVDVEVTSASIHVNIVYIQYFNVFSVSVVEEGVTRDAASYWWLQNKGECCLVSIPRAFAISRGHFQSNLSNYHMLIHMCSWFKCLNSRCHLRNVDHKTCASTMPHLHFDIFAWNTTFCTWFTSMVSVF